MLAPFKRETLDQDCFLKDEVRHNLLYRIAEGECATSLQAEDGGAVALQTVGRGLWFWIDPGRGEGYARAVIGELADALKGSALPSVSAAPENAALFARAYCLRRAAVYKLNTRLMAYSSRNIIAPVNVPGAAVEAGEPDVETVADFRSGFIGDIFHMEADREEMLLSAANLIRAGGLFLWVVDGKTVSMAAVAHRTARHARVNNVYTAAEERKKGYASALVAEVSRMVLEEGLIPMLYADIANPDSNKVYRSIGYIPADPIDEYEFQSEN